MLINGNSVSGVACSYNDVLGHVIFSGLPVGSVTNYTATFWASTANYATTSTLTFRYYQPATTTATSISNNLVQVTTTKSTMVCSWSSTSDIVGANTNYTVLFSSPVNI